MNNSVPAYKPSEGVKEDFSKLLEKFSEQESVRYEHFANVWKSMKFSLLCAGRQTDRERREFFEEVTHIALSFHLPPYNFQVRVGGLYILYSLFMTQPCIPKVPIRVTFEQWKQILEFQESMTHLDVSYIFHKLFTLKAFFFVATPQEVYIRRKNRSSQEKVEETLNDNLKVVANSVNSVFTPDVLQQLRALHTQYHQLKLGIAGPNADRPDRSLDVISGQLVDNIDGYMDDHNARQDKIRTVQKPRQTHKKKKNVSDSDVDSDDPDDSDYSPSKSKQARVKAQAFSNRAKQSKGRRHRTLITQDASASSPEKTPRRQAKDSSDKIRVYAQSSSSGQGELVWVCPPVPSSTDREDTEEEQQYLSMPTLDVAGAASTETVQHTELMSTSPKKEQDSSQTKQPNSSNRSSKKPKEKKTKSPTEQSASKPSKTAKSKPKAPKTPKSPKKGKPLKVKITPVKRKKASEDKTQASQADDEGSPPKVNKFPSDKELSRDIPEKAPARKKKKVSKAKLNSSQSSAAAKSDVKNPEKIIISYMPM